MIRKLELPALLAAVATAVAVLPATAAAQPLAVDAIQILNLDGPGEGFNDATAFTPTGGNPTTTVGEARLLAFRYAAQLWASHLESAVQIRVAARMDPLGGDALGAILGFAGPITSHRDFVNAPVAGTWYPQALANSLAGVDVAPGADDITATFNSDVDNGVVLGPANWYYGLDAAPPPGQVDFVTVVLHELGHGLGFLSLADPETGAKHMGADDAYLRHLEHHDATPSTLTAQTDVQRVASFVADPDLHWTGAETLAAAAALPLTAGFPSSHVQMHAPGRSSKARR